MTHPDFGERGLEEELTPEQVAIVDLAKTARLLTDEIKILKRDLMKLEEKLWTLKNEDKS